MSKKRRLERDGSAVSLISDIPIHLSQQDKGLVAMYWLLEIVLSSVVNMGKVNIPAAKTAMYRGLTTELFSDVNDVVIAVNDRFNNEINKVFGRDYQTVLADTCIAIITLLETMRPESVLGVLRAAGITPDVIAENWFRSNDKPTASLLPGSSEWAWQLSCHGIKVVAPDGFVVAAGLYTRKAWLKVFEKSPAGWEVYSAKK